MTFPFREIHVQIKRSTVFGHLRNYALQVQLNNGQYRPK